MISELKNAYFMAWIVPDLSWPFRIVLIVPDCSWPFLTLTNSLIQISKKMLDSWSASSKMLILRLGSFLTVLDCSCSFLIVAERCSPLLTVPDCSWLFLDVPERSDCSWLFLMNWFFLTAPDCFWLMIYPDGPKRSKKEVP